MLLVESHEFRALRRARQQPELEVTIVAVSTLLEEARRRLFPMLPHQLPSFFVPCGPLACVTFDQQTLKGTVFIHALLNHSSVPVHVLDLVCRHELLHLVVPAREVNGKLSQHPPEFMEKERAIIPDRAFAWEWIWCHCGQVLREDNEREGVIVKRGWRRQCRWWSARADSPHDVRNLPAETSRF